MMKKTIPILLMTVIASEAGAQTLSDALKFGDNNYYGTARTIAMGNAFTALGGDLGSITINPAGSAVNWFSQVTLTPNLSIYSSSAGYNAMPSQTSGFGISRKNSSVRFTVPNIGLTINYNTGAKHGLKNVTIGLVANATQNYMDNVASSGTNSATTFAGQMAAYTEGLGLPYSSLNDSNAYDNYDWFSVVGWQSGMISTYGDSESQYIGATEKLYTDNSISLAGNINQKYGRQSHGNKYDIVFNLGFNISDVFYFGGNLGVTTMNYVTNTYFKEIAADPDDFQIEYDDGSTYFNSLRYRYHYDVDGTGVYGKFGFIAVPAKWLRLGGTIQTPTATFLKEHWQHAGETHYSNSSYDASAISPEGEYQYKFVGPFRAGFGAAFTFGNLGLVSADYEYIGYSGMKFKETETNDQSAYDAVNQDIDDYTGGAHMIRVGAEFKPLPLLALRAGYNVTTSGERYYIDGVKKMPKAYRQAFSVGAGYSSKRSFFCDLAVRATKYPSEYIYPYSDYITDDSGNVAEYTPEIRNRATLWDVTATFGWRF